ncbi:hypothetical protein HHI36_021276 [Cryptolaemus montrouzieri]|uniref:NADAR domain-containing protein n=1 Tax=Cryptolaemus montrouzieri TaxID=559131 RepID=A0ABD2MWK2_9CUCU
MAIKGFRDKYKFLSNFYKCEVEYEGITYPTAEHAFQAAKTFNVDERKKILSTKNPVIAKRMGRKVKLRPDWEEVKYEIMTTIVRQKFQNADVKKLLLETGTNILSKKTNGMISFGENVFVIGAKVLERTV